MTLAEKIEEILNADLIYLENSEDKRDKVEADVMRNNNKTYAKQIATFIQETIPKEKTVEIVIKELGEGYSWGTYSLVNKSFNSALAEMRERLND